MSKTEKILKVVRVKNHKTICCRLLWCWEGKELKLGGFDKQTAFEIGSELIRTTLKPGTYEITATETKKQ